MSVIYDGDDNNQCELSAKDHELIESWKVAWMIGLVEGIIVNMSTPHNLQCQSKLAVSIRRDLLSFVQLNCILDLH